MELQILIDGFLLDCQARRLSPSTIDNAYAPCLRRLVASLGSPDVTSITTEDLRRYVADLTSSQPLSAWTIRSHTRTIKRLFAWATQEQIITRSPAENLRHPKIPQPRIEIFTRDEIDLILREARAISFRNYAVCFLFLDSGLRRGELAALVLDDVNVSSGRVTVRHGKGDKRRAVRVGNRCRKVLWLFVHEHRDAAPGVDAFFVNSNGRPLTANLLTQVMRRLSRRTGLHVHCHKFRHTFATLYARRVPNAILLADALGHSDLNMARHYVHLSGTQSTDGVSPMNGLLNK